MVLCLSACSTAREREPAGSIPAGVEPGSSEGVLLEKPTESASDRSPADAAASAPVALTGIEVNQFDSTAFDWLARSGAYWVRYNGVLWSDVEPQEGDLDWSKLGNLEDSLQQAARLNQEVILVVRGTPDWAQALPGSACGPIAPAKLAAFGDFMAGLVSRYSQPPYSVSYWELGNEPDIEPTLVPGSSPYGCWGDATDENYGGGRYADMLKAIYPRIKSVNPAAQVLVGGLLLDCDPVHPPENKDCRPAKFFEGLLAAGGADYFDGVSFHAYDYYTAPFSYGNQNWHSSHLTTGPVNAVKARHLESLLLEYGVPDRYLINTEAGLLCGRSGEEPGCQSYEFNLTKAFYAVQSNAAALRTGMRGNIWFNLTGWRGSGLLDGEGQALPAMSAMSFASAQLNSASFVRDIQEYPGLSGIEFLRDGKTIWLLWALEGAGVTVSFSDEHVKIYDVWGVSVPDISSMAITSAPVYIEWGG